MLKSKSFPILAGAAALGVAALFAAPSEAAVIDTLTATLNLGNAALAGFPPPYGTAEIDLLTGGASANVTFTSNTAGNPAYLFVDGSSVDLNIHITGTGFTVDSCTIGTACASITGTQVGTGFNAPQFTQVAATNVDGFGTFNLVIDNQDSFKQAVNSVSFTVNNTGGTWSSAADVIAPNSLLNDIAAHVAATCNVSSVTTSCPNTGINQANGAPATGFATVPAPSIGHGLPALLAVGGLLFGARFFGRRRSLLGAAIPRAA